MGLPSPAGGSTCLTGSNAQRCFAPAGFSTNPLGQGVPALTQAVRSLMAASGRRRPGGHLDLFMGVPDGLDNRLFSGSPGTRAGPCSPPFRRAARVEAETAADFLAAVALQAGGGEDGPDLRGEQRFVSRPGRSVLGHRGGRQPEKDAGPEEGRREEFAMGGDPAPGGVYHSRYSKQNAPGRGTEFRG